MALIGWDNWAERGNAALGAWPGTAAGYGVEQLRVPLGNRAVAMQTAPGQTQVSLSVTLPAAALLRVICLARTNLTPAAQVQVIGAGGSYFAGWQAAGVVAGVGQVVHVLPAAISVTWVQVDISDPGNPDGCLNIPLLWAGNALEFGISAESDTGVEVRRADVASRGGTVLTDALSVARQWQFRAGLLRDADLPGFAGLEAAAAAGRNILLIPRLGAPAAREALVGLLTPGRTGFIGPSGKYRSWGPHTMTERL